MPVGARRAGGELLVPQADGTADGLVRVGLELAVPDPRDDQDGDLASPVGELPAVAQGTAEGLERAPEPRAEQHRVEGAFEAAGLVGQRERLRAPRPRPAGDRVVELTLALVELVDGELRQPG